MNRPLFLIFLLLVQKTYAEAITTTGPASGVDPSRKEKVNAPPNVDTPLKKDDSTINPDLSQVNQVSKSAVFTNNSDIYEIKINENWSFSGLIKIENQKVFIPLKFLPSDLLGNLIFTDENTTIIKKEKNLVLPALFIKKRDDENLTLNLTLTENFFKSQLLLMDKTKQLDSHPITAFYTNYSLNIDNTGFNSLRGTLNSVWASKDNWLFKNGLYWDGNKWIRLNSTWQKTFKDYSGLAIGDVTDTSLTGFGSISTLGFKYSTPYFNSSTSLNQILPTIPVSGFAVTPSKIDLYLNNQIIQQQEVSSGRYSIDIPYQAQGYGVFQSYIYDLTGKPTIVSVPFYSSNEVVKKGSNEYSFTGGLIRKNTTTASFDYGKPYVSGIYKGGWGNNYTQDLYFQYSPYYSAISALGHVIPYPKLGLFNLSYSRNSENQSLFKLGWERSGSAFSVGGEIQRAENKKDGFCLGYGQSCISTQKTIFTGTSLPHGFGGLNLSYVARTTPTGENRIASLQWNKQVNKYVNIFSSLSSTKSVNIGSTATNNKIFYVGVSLNFDGHFYTNSAFTKDKNNGTGFQESAYKGENSLHPEYGYGSVTVNKTAKSTTENLYYGGRLNNFSYEVNSYKDSTGIRTNLNLDGGVAYIPEENYFKFVKSMDGGLVFVNIENLTIPAEISHENRYAGMSDSHGHFLVSDAVALNNENISIDINKLPKSITLEDNKKDFYIPFSGAVRVDFKSKPLPYVVKIKGVPSGAIFQIAKDYYVIGDKGFVSVEAEGDTQIPMDGGNICNIHISKKQKEYVCVSNGSIATPKTDTQKEVAPDSSISPLTDKSKDNKKEVSAPSQEVSPITNDNTTKNY